MIALPFIAAPVIYLIGRSTLRKGKLWGMSLARILAVLTLLADMLMLFLVVKQAMAGSGGQAMVGLVSLQLDGITLVLTTITLVLGLCVTLFSIPYMKHENNEEKYYALLLMTIGSII